MKKSLAHIVLGVAVLAVAGSGAAWYVVSGNVVTKAQAMIEQYNAKPHQDGSTAKLTYDHLGRVSFPYMGVRLTNPTITYASQPTGDVPGVNITWKRTGTVDLVSDYIGHEYRIISDGTDAAQLQSGDDKAALSASDTHTMFAVKAKTRQAFEAWGSMDLTNRDQLKLAAQYIVGITYSSTALSVSDATSGTQLYGYDKITINFVNRGNTALFDFDLDGEMKAMQATPAYGDFMMHVSRLLHLNVAIGDANLPMSASHAGKQDMEISLSVNSPSTKSDGPHSFIHLKKLKLHNDYYDFTAPVDVLLDKVAGRSSVTIHTDTKLEVSALGAQQMQRFFSEDPFVLKMLSRGSNAIDQAALKQKMLAVLPQLATASPIVLKLDMNLDLPTPKANEAVTAGQKLAISQFMFGNTRWAIELTAKGERGLKKGSATAEATLICRQCNKFTSDLYTTVNAVQDLLALTDPERVRWPLTDTYLAQVNTTLGEVGSRDEATNDITFTITTPRPGEYQINGRSIGQVMPQLMVLYGAAQPPRPEVPPVPPAKPAPKPAAKPVVKPSAKPAAKK